MPNPEPTRCGWVNLNEPLYVDYHDHEWGIPCHDDSKLFEMLCLEGAQAGLSWITILKKRASYRAAFDGFDPAKMARYDDSRMAALLADPGIVRNRLKVNAFIRNARAYLNLRESGTTLDSFLWGFVGGEPLINHWRGLAEVPAETAQSQAMSKALLQRGFKFVGPTICYAFMQACGLVDDHTLDCFKRDR
jgi:DNA-3-methyladenine glycosylase I